MKAVSFLSRQRGRGVGGREREGGGGGRCFLGIRWDSRERVHLRVFRVAIHRSRPLLSPFSVSVTTCCGMRKGDERKKRNRMARRDGRSEAGMPVFNHSWYFERERVGKKYGKKRLSMSEFDWSLCRRGSFLNSIGDATHT